MSKLILVKHSLPQITPGLPSGQWGLSAEGRRRCLALAGQLASAHPTRIVSSPEPCPLDTAQRIARKVGVPVLVNERLHMHRRGRTGYLSDSEFTRRVQQFINRPEELCFGEETASAVFSRFNAVIWRLMDQFPNQTVVVVTHGLLIALFVASITAEDAFSLWQRMPHPSYVVVRMPDLVLEEEWLQPLKPLREYA